MINLFDLFKDRRTPEEKRRDELKGKVFSTFAVLIAIVIVGVFAVGLNQVWHWLVH
jgi:hypothetical protein